jgi:hypothetical protein
LLGLQGNIWRASEECDVAKEAIARQKLKRAEWFAGQLY